MVISPIKSTMSPDLVAIVLTSPIGDGTRRHLKRGADQSSDLRNLSTSKPAKTWPEYIIHWVLSLSHALRAPTFRACIHASCSQLYVN